MKCERYVTKFSTVRRPGIINIPDITQGDRRWQIIRNGA